MTETHFDTSFIDHGLFGHIVLMSLMPINSGAGGGRRLGRWVWEWQRERGEG